jgi:hypothetical protein
MKRESLFTVGVLALVASVFYLTTETTSASGPNLKNVTFTRDVAPIFYRECVQCHRPNDLAPMSLLTYKEARPWARSIREKVISKQMPPWHADPHFGEFLNDRRLSQREIDTIAAWVDQGAKEGDAKDLPAAPAVAEGWHIGKPDVVLSMQEDFTFNPSGRDEYRYFKIPTNFKQDVYIQAAEAQPGNKKIVHHIIAFVAPPRPPQDPKAKKPAIPQGFIDAFMKQIIFYEDGRLQRVKMDVPVIDDGCSSPNGGQGPLRGDKGKDEDAMFLCGFSPGRDQDVFATGTAKRIPAGSSLILQIHYSRSGSAEKDRSRIGLVFSKEPPDKIVRTKPVANYHFQIPPGAENHEVTSCFSLHQDAHITALMPHMHLRGKDMTVIAYYPDGRSQVLLKVPQYSFSWQTNYYLKEPAAIPKGTRIECIAHFDNSPKNKYNPDPSKPVRFGDPTYDEMMIGFVEYTVDGEHLAKPDAARSGK